jgi:hypothetical protein
VDVVPPGRDTVKADSNYLTAPRRGPEIYRIVFNRQHVFSRNQVRVTYRLLVDGSLERAGYRDFVIIP